MKKPSLAGAHLIAWLDEIPTIATMMEETREQTIERERRAEQIRQRWVNDPSAAEATDAGG